MFKHYSLVVSLHKLGKMKAELQDIQLMKIQFLCNMILYQQVMVSQYLEAT